MFLFGLHNCAFQSLNCVSLDVVPYSLQAKVQVLVNQ